MRPSEHEALAALRKESVDLYNRLHSIKEDKAFVDAVKTAVVANLRCGAWYTDPRKPIILPSYFKSTDGHTSNWSFNLRRPNLHILPTINEHNGIILVDSTRSGKRMPDAFSRTLPIWCAVINRAILLRFPTLSQSDWDKDLYTPPTIVSRQEHDQIERLIDGWAEALMQSTYHLPLLSCPLRPLWITPATSTFPQVQSVPFLPVLCISASRQVLDGIERRTSDFSYVQGSGDDHELWGQGLEPVCFWNNMDLILSTSRTDIDNVVASLINQQNNGVLQEEPDAIAMVNGLISICAQNEYSPDTRAYLILSSFSTENGRSVQARKISIKTEEGKRGQSHFLHNILPQADHFLQTSLLTGHQVCIACPTGNDLSPGVALLALQKYFDDTGSLAREGNTMTVNKKSIRKRLEWIIASRPQVNPSRATLKRVNEYLLSGEFKCSP